jgi:hypothetical protein
MKQNLWRLLQSFFAPKFKLELNSNRLLIYLLGEDICARELQ